MARQTDTETGAVTHAQVNYGIDAWQRIPHLAHYQQENQKRTVSGQACKDA